ncbi:MAG TPA: putative lipid II flippase FtsW [Chromatiales bacterium]|nr:putative lipid II flippase FtsW [Thiotrichales bacterium]HIP69451.1 putative lipid II flippase FtsW [Chromatiales bacterium]
MLHATRSPGMSLNAQLQQRLDIGLLVALLVLLGLGLVMVASASIGLAEKNFDSPFYYLQRQLVFISIGLMGGWIMYQLPLRLWEHTSLLLLFLACLLLTAVLIPGIGKTVNGATRWIDLGPVPLQVSELAKLLVALYLAGYMVRHGQAVRERFSGFIKPVLLISFVAALLLAEPDYGAAVVIMAMSLGMLFLGGVRLIQFLLLLGLTSVGFALLAISSPYRLQRLTSFLDPWADPYNTGFQLTHSLIAIGSGSWSGLGLGGSIQKLLYLPEPHNDFLFAILAEELGLIGVITVLCLYVYVVFRGFAIGAAAERAGHYFGAYLAFGLSLWIGLQAFINIGVNMGVLPTKGLTLPLMSAGGSSMVVMCAVLGLLLRVYRETHGLVSTSVRSSNGRGLRT